MEGTPLSAAEAVNSAPESVRRLVDWSEVARNSRIIIETEHCFVGVPSCTGRRYIALKPPPAADGSGPELRRVEGRFTGVVPFVTRPPQIGYPDLMSLDRARDCALVEAAGRDGLVPHLIPIDAATYYTDLPPSHEHEQTSPIWLMARRGLRRARARLKR